MRIQAHTYFVWPRRKTKIDVVKNEVILKILKQGQRSFNQIVLKTHFCWEIFLKSGDYFWFFSPWAHVDIEFKNVVERIVGIARSYSVKEKLLKSPEIHKSFIYECSIDAEEHIYVIFLCSGSLNRTDEEGIEQSCYVCTLLFCFKVASCVWSQPSVVLVCFETPKIDRRVYKLESPAFYFFSRWIATRSMKTS